MVAVVLEGAFLPFQDLAVRMDGIDDKEVFDDGSPRGIEKERAMAVKTSKSIMSVVGIVAIGGVAWSGCMDVAFDADDPVASDSSELASPIEECPQLPILAEYEVKELVTTIHLSSSQTSSWPRTVTWTGDHAHAPYMWDVSWSGSNIQTCGTSISRTVSSETCGVTAEVIYDSGWHGSNPRSVNVIDDRDFSVPAYHSLQLNQPVTLVMPDIYRGGHCDGLGTCDWQRLTSSGWEKLPGTTNADLYVSGSPNAGVETYRISCTHPHTGAHQSNEVDVEWVASTPPPTASLTCYETGYPMHHCAGSGSGGVSPLTPLWQADNGAWYPGGWTGNYVCKYRPPHNQAMTVRFKVRDSNGQESSPKTWLCAALIK